jgi:hypothetical protein
MADAGVVAMLEARLTAAKAPIAAFFKSNDAFLPLLGPVPTVEQSLNKRTTRQKVGLVMSPIHATLWANIPMVQFHSVANE